MWGLHYVHSHASGVELSDLAWLPLGGRFGHRRHHSTIEALCYAISLIGFLDRKNRSPSSVVAPICLGFRCRSIHCRRCPRRESIGQVEPNGAFAVENLRKSPQGGPCHRSPDNIWIELPTAVKAPASLPSMLEPTPRTQLIGWRTSSIESGPAKPLHCWDRSISNRFQGFGPCAAPPGPVDRASTLPSLLAHTSRLTALLKRTTSIANSLALLHACIGRPLRQGRAPGRPHPANKTPHLADCAHIA